MSRSRCSPDRPARRLAEAGLPCDGWGRPDALAASGRLTRRRLLAAGPALLLPAGPAAALVDGRPELLVVDGWVVLSTDLRPAAPPSSARLA